MREAYAWIGRIDCKGCKDRKWKGLQTRKIKCSQCKNKGYIPICLLCDNPYPKGCNCYDWWYEYEAARIAKIKKIA